MILIQGGQKAMSWTWRLADTGNKKLKLVGPCDRQITIPKGTKDENIIMVTKSFTK